MVDRLAALMTHFPMRAQVFNTGRCAASTRCRAMACTGNCT